MSEYQPISDAKRYRQLCDAKRWGVYLSDEQYAWKCDYERKMKDEKITSYQERRQQDG